MSTLTDQTDPLYPLYKVGTRVMEAEGDNRFGEVLSSQVQYGGVVYAIKDDDGVEFLATQESLISIW
jgi:hypothetical protein